MYRLLQLLSILCFFVLVSSFTILSHNLSRQCVLSNKLSTPLHAVIEREAPLKDPGTTVVQPQTDSDEKKSKNHQDREEQRHKNEEWEVRIFDDRINTREHVARSLVQITGMPENIAYQTMMQSHKNGLAIVGRYAYEIAEMYNHGLEQQGIVSDLRAV